MNSHNTDPGQDPNCNLNEDGTISYKTQTQCQEDVQPLPQAMVVALDAFKDRKENGAIAYAIEEEAQPLSGPVVAGLTTFLTEYRGENVKNGSKSSARTPPEGLSPGLNAGSTFVVRDVDTDLDAQEIWAIEDVVSNQLSSIQTPATLLPDSTDLNALLNTGVIPMLERTPDGLGMTKYRFSLASLADGRKTPLYEWVWFTLPTFA